jgi:hypothetical protein
MNELPANTTTIEIPKFIREGYNDRPETVYAFVEPTSGEGRFMQVLHVETYWDGEYPHSNQRYNVRLFDFVTLDTFNADLHAVWFYVVPDEE